MAAIATDLNSVENTITSNQDACGLAIIVTCDYQTNGELTPLLCTHKDAQAMTNTFKSLNFATHCESNIDGSRLRTLLRETSRDISRHSDTVVSKYKCIVFVFSGHGGEEKGCEFLCAEDYEEKSQAGKVLLQNEIIMPLVKECTSIPKLFLIDACRGKEPLRHKQHFEVKSPVGEPMLTNHLEAYATLPKHVAHTTPEGSIWMMALATELRERDDSVQNILGVVKHNLHKKYRQHELQHYWQQPSVERNTLNCGPLYLHPQHIATTQLPREPVPASPAQLPEPQSEIQAPDRIDVNQCHHEYSVRLREAPDSIKLLVAGKMGTGKSSLINSFLGEEAAEEGDSPDAVTQEVGTYSTTFVLPIETDGGLQEKRVQLVLWDMPGLSDPFAEDEELSVIEGLRQKCREADLLIYCLDMTARFTSEDSKLMKLLTGAAGEGMWRNAIIALTFANDVRGGQQEFPAKLRKWRKRIMETLLNLPVAQEIVEDLPIAPTGYRDRTPPGYTDWLTLFWIEAFLKMKERARPLLVAIDSGRMRVLPQGLSIIIDAKEKTAPPKLNAAQKTGVVLTSGFLFGALGMLVGCAAGPFAPLAIPITATIGAMAGVGVGMIGPGVTFMMYEDVKLLIGGLRNSELVASLKS